MISAAHVYFEMLWKQEALFIENINYRHINLNLTQDLHKIM